MEEKARKYCSLYKVQPTLALTCMYRDLSQNLINGLCDLLLSWCLYAAECDDAFLDFNIPIDFEQLHSFTFELLSRKQNDTLVISRAVYLLRNQKTPLKNLTNILKNLEQCKHSETVMILSAVINARIGKDVECISLCETLSRTSDLDNVRSRLHLLSNADLELLKLIMQGNELKNGSTAVNMGINNSGYTKEDQLGKKASRKHDVLSATSVAGLHSTEIVETSFFENEATSIIFLDEVLDTLAKKIELSTYLGEILDFHIRASRTFHALWTLLSFYRDNDSVPRLDTATALQLHEPLLHIVKGLKDACIDERNEGKESPKKLAERAVIYCKIAKYFDIVDIEASVIYMECLTQTGRTNEALDLGKELLGKEKQNEDVLFALALCKLNQGKYFSALNDINQAIKLTTQKPDHISLRGFTNILAGSLEQGMADITAVCKDELSVPVSMFKSLKLADQKKIKERIIQCIKSYLDIGLIRAADSEDDFAGFNYDETQQGSENKLHQIRRQCDFLTKVYQRDLSVHLIYADVLVRLKRYEDAQELLVLFIQKVPEDPFPMIHLANLRMRLGAYVAAVQDFRIINLAIGSVRFAEFLMQLSVEDRQEIARVHRQHGFRYLQNNKSYADAIECFNIAIIALCGAATGLILVRGFCYANLGDYELALNDFLSVLDREPDNTAAIVSRSVIYSVFDYEEETLKGLGTILKDNKEVAVKVLQKVPITCVRLFTTSMKNYVSKVLDDRTSIIDPNSVELAGIYSEFLSSTFKTTQYRCLYSKYLLTYGKYEDSLREVEAVLRTEQDCKTALAQKVFLLAKMSKMRDCLCVMRTIDDDGAEELEYYVGMLRISEKNALRSMVLTEAKTKSEAKDHVTAIRWYSLALIVIGRKDIELLRGRFEAFIDEGLIEKALSDISAIIDVKPTYEDYCTRAKLHDSIGKEKLAWNDYMRAIELDEERTITLLNEQSILKHVLCLFCIAANGAFVRERYKEVLRLCDFGLKLDPNHKGLKQLRYRTKCVVNRCIIQ